MSALTAPLAALARDEGRQARVVVLMAHNYVLARDTYTDAVQHAGLLWMSCMSAHRTPEAAVKCARHYTRGRFAAWRYWRDAEIVPVSQTVVEWRHRGPGTMEYRRDSPAAIGDASIVVDLGRVE